MAGKKQDIDPIDAYVGNRVKLKRNMHDLSQEKLGEKLGITFQQVQKYEKGTNRISASRLYQICNIFSTPIDFFLPPLHGEGSTTADGFADDGTNDYQVDFPMTVEELKLQQSFAKIKNPKLRKHIAGLVSELGKDD